MLLLLHISLICNSSCGHAWLVLLLVLLSSYALVFLSLSVLFVLLSSYARVFLSLSVHTDTGMDCLHAWHMNQQQVSARLFTRVLRTCQQLTSISTHD
jgi:hypothetical protein